MIRAAVALVLATVLLSALIGSGGHLEAVVPGWALPLFGDSRSAAPSTARPGGTAAGQPSLAELKNMSPDQLREVVRANPELIAGKSTSELAALYQQYRQEGGAAIDSRAGADLPASVRDAARAAVSR